MTATHASPAAPALRPPRPAPLQAPSPAAPPTPPTTPWSAPAKHAPLIAYLTGPAPRPAAPRPADATPRSRVPVTLIEGDGVGPEITAAVRRILDAAGAPLAWEPALAGARARGASSGIPRETLDAIARTGLVLRGPLAAAGTALPPSVALRQMVEAYGTVRPVRELPRNASPYAGRGIDLVVVRESVEDLYAGGEYAQTPGVAQALKLTTRDGCARVAHLACSLAAAEQRGLVTCVTKANVQPLTDGMLREVFAEVAAEYPNLRTEHRYADEVARELVRRPEAFDVLLTTNAHGDVLSDLAAGLVGGAGVAASASVGPDVAIFEPVHGPEGAGAGRGVANPIGLLRSALMLLRHVGDAHTADRVERALARTLHDGFHPVELGGPSTQSLCTSAFADAVVERLDDWRDAPGAATRARDPRPRSGRLIPASPPDISDAVRPSPAERTVGLDVFIQFDRSPRRLGDALRQVAAGTVLRLAAVANRGVTVYPDAGARAGLSDLYRCRFLARDASGEGLVNRDLLDLLDRIGLALRWVHVERLREFDGVPGFTPMHGDN